MIVLIADMRSPRVAKDFVSQVMAGARPNGGNLMTDHAPTLHEPRFLRFTFGALWRAVVIISFVWIIGGTLDGANPQEIIAVPLVVAAWAFDRWVLRGDQN
jgi:hypothetical protein